MQDVIRGYDRRDNMGPQSALERARERFLLELEVWMEENPDLRLDEEVVISSALTPQEAIGRPERDDYPILRGKEVLMQAVYKSSCGQAFTPHNGSFQGSLRDILELNLNGNFERAVLIATMNAVLSHQRAIEGTVHCRNDEPARCASCLKEWLKRQDLSVVGLIGMQPALLEALVEGIGADRVRVSDLANAGKVSCGIEVQDGLDCSELFRDCDLIFATGSTLANGTIDGILADAEGHGNRLIFYGTTIAGAAYLLGLDRWCPFSK